MGTDVVYVQLLWKVEGRDPIDLNEEVLLSGKMYSRAQHMYLWCVDVGAFSVRLVPGTPVHHAVSTW